MYNSDLNFKDQCLDIPNTVCLNGGDKVISTLNKSKSLIGWWSFDDSFGHDHSGNNLLAKPVPEAGPSNFIKGYSAYLDGETQVNIPNFSNLIPESNMTIMFWVYLLEDSTGNWRTLLHKGDSIQELSPTIQLWPKERKLHVRVGTDIFWNEGIESNAQLNMKQWTHIAVTMSGQMLQLFVNGNLDKQMILNGKIKLNSGEFHLGKDPWRPGVKCFIDELKIYNRSLPQKEIEQIANLNNLLIGPNYTLMGCESCSFVQAMSSCGDKFHLCSYSELYSGAYLIARRNGWFNSNTEVWARESQSELDKLNDKSDLGNPEVKKMAICCSDK